VNALDIAINRIEVALKAKPPPPAQPGKAEPPAPAVKVRCIIKPVDFVNKPYLETPDDVEAFIKWASEKTGKKLRLATEAEWEYASRAGSTGRYCFGDDPALLTEYGWYAGNSDWVTHPVGQKKPNRWGLYDMHGNVAEWVSDWYAYYPGGPQTDPTGPPAGGAHAWHECSWSSKPYECRCSQRDRADVKYKSAALGLRVACDP
jgi:formylglycine-generating enzyme required for sulfatase activity